MIIERLELVKPRYEVEQLKRETLENSNDIAEDENNDDIDFHDDNFNRC